MLHALTAQARQDREDGFTLIEILVAMVLMAIIMSSLAVFFIGSQKTSTALRSRQAAAVIADESMDHVHSLNPLQLLHNRDQSTSDTQWHAAQAGTTLVGVDTLQMNEAYDQKSVPPPASGTGADPTQTQLPTVPTSQTVNGITYQVNYVIGTCSIPRGGGDCTAVPPSDPILMDRVVVAVNWRDLGTGCPLHTCAYVVASLISPTNDLVFNINEVLVDTTPPSTPSTIVCSQQTDQSNSVDSWTAATDASGIGRYDIYRLSSDFSVRTQIGSKPASASVTDSGLVPSTKYWYEVLAVDTVGNVSGPQVPPGTVTNPQAPYLVPCTTKPDTTPPFLGAAATATNPLTSTTTSLNVSWPLYTDDYKIDHFNLYRVGVPTPIASNLSATTTSFTDTGLLPWTNYQYYVVAFDPAGNSRQEPTSALTRTKDTSPPTVPASVVATPKPWPSLEIDLDWADSTDDVGTTGYTVYRSTSSAGPWTTAIATPTTSSYADTGSLVGSQTYYYCVTAHDAAGNNSGCGYAHAATPDTIAPTVPTNVTAGVKTPTTIALSWTASTDAVGVTGYAVYRDGGTTPVGTTTTTSFVDSGLTQLTSYGYTVKAYDAAGNFSADSTSINASTTDGTPPNVPVLSLSSRTTTTVTLTWPAVTDNLLTTGYAIYRNGSPTPLTTTAGTTFTDTGLAASTAYTYTVKAYDAAGNYSGSSNVVSTTTLPDTSAPTNPTVLTLGTKTMTTVTMSWTGSSDNVGVTGYAVYRNGGTTPVGSTATGVTTFTDTGPLTPGAPYTYTVKAYDAAGNYSGASNTLSVTTSADSTPPSQVTGVGGASGGPRTATISWAPATDNVGVTSYKVVMTATIGGPALATTTGAALSASFAGLNLSSTFYFTVVANDAAGNAGAASSPPLKCTVSGTGGVTCP